jgi:hypothetical protein
MYSDLGNVGVGDVVEVEGIVDMNGIWEGVLRH